MLISGELYSSYSAVGNFRCEDTKCLSVTGPTNQWQTKNDLETVTISHSGWKKKNHKKTAKIVGWPEKIPNTRARTVEKCLPIAHFVDGIL